MKILHVLNHSFPLLDGYASRSQNIFKAQEGMGLKPIVLTSPKHEADLKKYFPKEDVIDGIRFYRTGRNPLEKIPVLGDLFQMVQVLFRLLWVIKKERPVLVHVHSPVLNALPAMIACRLFGLPIVYEIRAFWEDAGVDQGTYKEMSLKYKLVRLLETWVCKTVDQVAVLCEGIKNDLISRGIRSEKMTPVYNGINPENFTPCPPDETLMRDWHLTGKTVLGFIGSFYRYEGLDLLVEAFSKLTSKHQNLALLLVGGGEMETQLKEQVKSLGIEERVIMPGRIPHSRVKGVYAMIDILVYPRYSVRLTELVTPLKPLEAMAMKKVLIASDIGGHRELIKNKKTGLLFKAGDANDLSKVILQALSNPKICQNLRHCGYQYVTEYKTWQKTISVHKIIYSRALSILNTIMPITQSQATTSSQDQNTT